MSVWDSFLFGPDVAALKRDAFELKEQLANVGWYKRIGIRHRLVKVLDEIDYQEGRLQYANRPYSFPTARIQDCLKDNICRCGRCWAKIRKETFGI